MTDSPYQRDYLQIIGVLTAIGALLFGVVVASVATKRDAVPMDRRALLIAGVLVVLVVAGAALTRARLWGGALLATVYLAIAFWFVRLAIGGMHTMSLGRLASTFAAAMLLMVPAALVLRWRRFLH